MYRWGKFGGTRPNLFWNDRDAYGITFSFQTTRVTYDSDSNGFMNAGWFNCELVSGLYYWEIDITELDVADGLKFAFKNAYDGIIRAGDDFGICQVYITSKIYDAAIYDTKNSPYVSKTGDVTANAAGAQDAAQGDRMMFAVNFTTGKGWIGKNGTFFNSGNPAAGTNPTFSTLPSNSEYPWQFQMCANIVSAQPMSFNACFDGSPFPQLYSTPAGFTSGIPAPAANFYPGWAPRKATAFGTSHYRHNSDTLDRVSWFSLATQFIGDDGHGGNVAPILPDEKIYFEMRSSGSPGAFYEFGVQDFSSWTVGQFAFMWGEDASLVSDYGVVDSTGVLTYAIDVNLMIAVDNAAGKIWLGKAGTWFNSGNPATGVNPQITGLPNQMWGVSSGVETQTGGWILRSPSTFSHATPAGFQTGIPSCLVPGA